MLGPYWAKSGDHVSEVTMLGHDWVTMLGDEFG